jgi:hypothetical protein
MNPQERERAAEQWLDEAIEQYRLVGPRAGLEMRILSGLRAHSQQGQRRWIFVLASSAAAVLVAVLMASWPRSKPDAPPTVVQKTTAPNNTALATTQVAGVKQAPKKNRLLVHEPREVETMSVSQKLVLRPAVEVREATFPAAAPLTDQGRLLQTYLRQTSPRELALVAARQRSTEKLEDLHIAPLQIEDINRKSDAEKDQD